MPTNPRWTETAMTSEDMSSAEIVNRLYVSGIALPCSASIKSCPYLRRWVTRSKCRVMMIALTLMKVAARTVTVPDWAIWRHA